MIARPLLALALAAPLVAQNAVRAGRFVVEPATLLNLGFEWEISGDANRNAAVDVRYRETGATVWKGALPLLRMGGERIFRAAEHLEYTVPDRFAGSILDLKPDTEYECSFTMRDPDGVSGQAAQVAKVRTRREPQPAKDGRILHVYPPGYRGQKQEPSFTGIMAAYYGSGLGDWNVVWERKAQPGDILLVHAGLYKANRLDYVDALATPFDGTYQLSLKGTPDRPIVIKAAGDGEVIFDGAGGRTLFDVMGSEYHMFEGLTIRNADIAFLAGQKGVAGAKGLTVRNCRIEDVGIGVVTEYAGSRDFFIMDNVFLGRLDRYRMIGWSNPGIYGAHPLLSYYAVKVYGSGHVIAYNDVAYFHDAIDVSTYGTPESEQELKAVAIDIYNNDIHLTGDDFIETDGGVHNIRVMRNRCVNSPHGGISAQPVFGGPAYIYRNVLYNVPSGVAFKFSAKPGGLLVYHNTVIAEHTIRDPHSNTHFRNNLFLGTDSPGRGIAVLANATAYSSYDYDGFRPNRAARAQYTWLGGGSYQPAAGDWKSFATLAEFREATGQEAHGIEVDYDIFENLKPPDPSNRYAVYHAMDLNFRLKPDSKAVDAGVRLPTINDDFVGKAPDLGAIEAGRPEPQYGPRRGTGMPFYR
ncbi:MAG: hypothetical protein LAQ30_04560 [Acidobacteriia bacterium]|nr:hypothetical protein [Terriglobia bacterium]